MEKWKTGACGGGCEVACACGGASGGGVGWRASAACDIEWLPTSECLVGLCFDEGREYACMTLDHIWLGPAPLHNRVQQTYVFISCGQSSSVWVFVCVCVCPCALFVCGTWHVCLLTP